MAAGFRSSNKLNQNFETIEDAFDNTISRNGSGPNFMLANFDMNNFKILNLPAPSDPSDVIRLSDLVAAQVPQAEIAGLANKSLSNVLGPDFSSVAFAADAVSGLSMRTANLAIRAKRNLSFSDLLGVVGDGVNNDGPTILAATSSSVKTWSVDGLHRFTAVNTIIPNGSVINFDSSTPNTGFYVQAGSTLTINGVVNAPTDRQIFFGDGTINGLKVVHAAWFGAKGDGVTDDWYAIQRAVTCANQSNNSDGVSPVVNFNSGTFLASKPILVFPEINNPMSLVGAGMLFDGNGGTRIANTAGFVGFAQLGIIANFNYDTLTRTTFLNLDKIALIAGTGKPQTGLFMGSTDPTKELDQPFMPALKITDCYFENYDQNIFLSNVRQFIFKNCTTWHDTGGNHVTAQAIGNGFLGDGIFESCTFRNPYQLGAQTGKHFVLRATDPGATENDKGNLRGIRWKSCIFYNADVSIDMKVENFIHCPHKMADLWFDDCQWDGNFNRHIQGVADNSGILGPIWINHCYMVGALTADNSVQMISSASRGTQVEKVVLTNGGSGGVNGTFYPITFTGGGGTGAAGIYSVVGGVVRDVYMTNPGTGYTSNPTVSFPQGAGAVAGVAKRFGFGSIANHNWNNCFWEYIAGRCMSYEGGTNINVVNPQLDDCGSAGSSAAEHFYFNNVDNLNVSNPRAIQHDGVLWPGLGIGVNVVGVASKKNNTVTNTGLGTIVGAQNNQTTGGTNSMFINVTGTTVVAP